MKLFLVAVFWFWCGVSSAAFVGHENQKKTYQETSNKQKLIVFLFDGFKWDYVDRMPKGSLAGFERLQKEGSRAEWVKPIFPSVSYPSWTTLSTGLYAESHNIIGNYMYDFGRNEAFSLFNTTSTQRAHWWTAEPIWTTATRQGKKVGLFLWQRCDVPFMGIRPGLCEGYTAMEGSKVLEKNVGKAYQLLEEEDYDMVMLYNSHLDDIGHQFGPHTKELQDALQDVDAIIYRLTEKIRNGHLKDQVSVMVVSDHGMTDGRKESGMIYIDVADFIDPADIKLAVEWAAIMGITPQPGKLDIVYNHLKKMPGVTVYKREDIPDSFHYKKGTFVQELVLVAKPGFFIHGFDSEKQIPRGEIGAEWGGFHGYPADEKDMRTVFFGWGPAFKSHYRGSHLELVDMYQMYAHIIGVDPLPHNGSWERVQQYLTSASVTLSKSTFVILSAMLYCLI